MPCHSIFSFCIALMVRESLECVPKYRKWYKTQGFATKKRQILLYCAYLQWIKHKNPLYKK